MVSVPFPARFLTPVLSNKTPLISEWQSEMLVTVLHPLGLEDGSYAVPQMILNFRYPRLRDHVDHCHYTS
jgi:hypothetical protein